jgi:cytochrome c oxidase cbb3-type subunit III
MLEQHKHKHATHDFDGITENRVNSPPAYFNVLFFGLVLWGLVFMAYFLFSGWSSDAEFQAKMEAHKQASAAAAPAAAARVTSPAKADPAAGQKIFATTCAMCHGANGEGGIGPDLRGELKYGGTRDAVYATISKGRPNGMPAFGSQLSGNDLENLVAFVLSLKK